MTGYVSPFTIVTRTDFTVRPATQRRMHLMPAGAARWAGEEVQCGGPGLCRECWREVHWEQYQRRAR